MTRWLPPDLFLLFLPSNSWPFFFFLVKIEHRAWPATDILSTFFSYVFRMDLAQSLNLSLLSD